MSGLYPSSHTLKSGLTSKSNVNALIIQRLRTSEAKFRALFEQAPIGIARMAPDGHWLELNDKLCEILGYSATELQAKTFVEITHPADHKQDEVFYNQFVSGELESCVFEKRYLHAGGHPVWSRVSVSAIRQDSGELESFIVTVEDVSERKQAEVASQQRSQELRQMNRRLAHMTRALEQRNTELQEFAYVVSHDLKAPLRAIASLSEWIEDDLEGTLPEDSKAHLQLMRQRIGRMGNLLDGLLDYSRVGRQQGALETVEVQALLHGVIDSLGADEDCCIELIGEMPTLQTRRVSLGQVFSNLIGNALKYCDRPVHIRITAKNEEDHYVFFVQDNGPGIDPAYHDKIFGIFQTLQPRDQVESTGVGLAIVKKVIETEGGSICLTSAPGEGTTFRFSWPKVSAGSDEEA